MLCLEKGQGDPIHAYKYLMGEVKKTEPEWLCGAWNKETMDTNTGISFKHKKKKILLCIMKLRNWFFKEPVEFPF